MKKNDWILLLSVSLYSYLFYQQSPGINFFLFDLALLTGIYLKDPVPIKTKTGLLFSAGVIISGGCIVFYSSPLAIITNLISLASLSAVAIAPKTSLLTGLLMSLYSVTASCVLMFLDWARRKKNQAVNAITRPLHVKLLMVLLILIVSTLFLLMYQSSNPLFKDFTKNIRLDFISWSWLFFTFLGLLLVYGFYYNRRIWRLSKADENAESELSQESAFKIGFLNSLFQADTEFLTGMILLVLLNIMLLVLNVLDLRYLWFDGTLPEGMNHRDFVHDGVGSLIGSIISAIVIILYFFRGRLNFHPKNNYLKYLAYVWILQNVFMIFSTSYRNNMYIADFGISYKKIGLYLYLLLTFIGLIGTMIKIVKVKSNWFLIRNIPRVYFGILVLSCLMNWDNYITRFNINKALNENKPLEKYYLVDLSFKNIPALIQLPDTIKGNDDYEIRDYYFSSRGTFFYSFKTALDNKLFLFMKDMEKQGWQSYCSEKSRVLRDILKLHEDGKIRSLSLGQNNYITTLFPIKKLNRIEELDLNNTYFRKPEELIWFPSLKKLSLDYNQIDSIDKLPVLSQLRELELRSNKIADLAALKNVPNVETLDISYNGLTDLSKMPVINNLRSLDISANPLDNFSFLSKFKHLQVLNLGNTFKSEPYELPVLDSVIQLNLSANEIVASKASVLFEKLRSFKNLTTLDLSGNLFENLRFLTDAYWKSNQKYDSVSSQLPQVKILRLSGNILVNTNGIEFCKNLEEVYVDGNRLLDIGALSQLIYLKTLYINGNTIRNLFGLEKLTKLESLNIANCEIQKGWNLISALTSLKWLDASNNNMRTISSLVNLTSLNYLNLENNQIKELKGIEKLQNLEELDLKNNNNIKDFSPLYKLKKLKIIHINYMEKVEFLKLKKALPNCRVYDLYRD
jgi:Leucine-rich repeat (LRR) protein